MRHQNCCSRVTGNCWTTDPTVRASEATLGNNDKVEMAVGECLRIQQPNFYCYRNFKLKTRFDKLSLSMSNSNDKLVE